MFQQICSYFHNNTYSMSKQKIAIAYETISNHVISVTPSNTAILLGNLASWLTRAEHVFGHLKCLLLIKPKCVLPHCGRSFYTISQNKKFLWSPWFILSPHWNEPLCVTFTLYATWLLCSFARFVLNISSRYYWYDQSIWSPHAPSGSDESNV